MLLPPYGYTRSAAAFQIPVTVLALIWCWKLPPPGYAVALLGFAAVVMAFRGQRLTQPEEIIWVCIAFLLFVVEIRAIRSDRFAQDTQHKQELAEERRSFRTVLDQDAQGFAALAQNEALTTVLPILLSESIRRQEEVYRQLAELGKTVAPLRTGYELKIRAANLSRDIVQFLSDRQSTAPPFPTEPMDANSPQFRTAIAYMSATISDYNKRFYPDVVRIHDALKSSGADTTDLDRFYYRNGALPFIGYTASEIGRLAKEL